MSENEPDKISSIMPPGVPHWVLGTSNSLCTGRHFYAESTIKSSAITIVQSFIGTALTNNQNIEARTLLFQLLVFWSLRLDKVDIDGVCFFSAQWSILMEHRCRSTPA
jgi:hypothetical protein